MRAALEAQYGIELPVALTPAVLATLTIWPRAGRERLLRGSCQLERADQVDGEDLLPGLGRHRVEIFVRNELRRTGVVDQDVETAEASQRFHDKPSASCVVGDVGW